MSDAPRRRAGDFIVLESWRGIASLAVVCYHWGELALRRYPELEGHWLYELTKYGGLGVQVFFIISGYCIAAAAFGSFRKGDSIGTYTVKRLRRIYPPYWAALLLNIFFILGSQWLVSHGVVKGNIFTEGSLFNRSPNFYISNLTLTMFFFAEKPLVSVAWTLCYEVAFYVIIGLALWAAIRLKRAPLVLNLLHALTVVSLLWLLTGPKAVPFPLELWPQFGLGVVLFDILARPHGEAGDRAARGWAGGIAVLMLALVFLYDTPIGAMNMPVRLQYAVTLGFAAWLLFSYRFDLRWSTNPVLRVLGVIGLFSYSLYLTHTLTIRLISLAIIKMGLPVGWHYILFAVALGLALLGAYIFFWLFERPWLPKRTPTPAKEVEKVESSVRVEVATSTVQETTV